MNFTKITALLKNVVKIIPATKSRTAVAALTLPAFADVVYDFFQIQPSPDTKRNFKTHLLELSVQGEEQLQEFMKALHVCIADVSHQYRINLEKQIQFADRSLQNNIEFETVKSDGLELKGRLEKFRIMAENVGQMAFNQAVASMYAGSDQPEKIVCEAYCRFEKLCKDEFDMNAEYEQKMEKALEAIRTTAEETVIGNDRGDEELKVETHEEMHPSDLKTVTEILL